MAARKQRKYEKHQWVEIGNGKKRKPLVGEILGYEKSYRFTQCEGRAWGNYSVREVRSTVIQYDILFSNGSRKWIYQEQILRALPDPSQDDLEVQARRMLGEDYL